MYSTPITPEVPIPSPTAEATPELAGNAQAVVLVDKDKMQRQKNVGGGSTMTRKSARIPIPHKPNRSDAESGDAVAMLEPSKKKRKKG